MNDIVKCDECGKKIHTDTEMILDYDGMAVCSSCHSMLEGMEDKAEV